MIRRSSTSDPWRSWLTDARMFARTACSSSARVLPEVGRQQRFDRRPDAADDGPQVARALVLRLLKFFEGGDDGAALRVSEHHHEPRAEPRRRELHAVNLRRGDDVARHADDEQVAEALIEDHLGRHARVGAAQDDGERLLTGRQRQPPGAVRDRIAVAQSGHEAGVALAQPRERLLR